MRTIIHKRDKQQRPTVKHRELHSLSYNGKESEKEYIHIAESLCCTPEKM